MGVLKTMVDEGFLGKSLCKPKIAPFPPKMSWGHVAYL